MSRAHPRKTCINRELISSFEAYAREKNAYYQEKKSLVYWVRLQERFAEPHLCNLYVNTPIARITGCLSSLSIYVGDSPCNYSVAIRVNRVMMLGSLCAETIKPVS